MPSVPYMNRSAAFWDWVASLEQEGSSHPFFSQFQNGNGPQGRENGDEHHESRAGPPFPPPHQPPSFTNQWPFVQAWMNPGSSWTMPHRERETAEQQHTDEDFDEKTSTEDKEKEKAKDMENGEGPAGHDSDRDGHRCGPGRRWARRDHHHGGPHGPGGFGSRGHWGGGHHGGRRGGHCGRGGRGPWGRGGAFHPLAGLAALFDPEQAAGNGDNNEDFTPDADVFDTPESFVIHVSLPGAKKEDVGVNWDAEKSELSIAGVIYRPADEEMLKTLAMSDRKVGAFERKIRLGTRANPANVDVDQISAKLEDGVLRVTVPKLGDNGFVEVTKVDIE